MTTFIGPPQAAKTAGSAQRAASVRTSGARAASGDFVRKLTPAAGSPEKRTLAGWHARAGGARESNDDVFALANRQQRVVVRGRVRYKDRDVLLRHPQSTRGRISLTNPSTISAEIGSVDGRIAALYTALRAVAWLDVVRLARECLRSVRPAQQKYVVVADERLVDGLAMLLPDLARVEASSAKCRERMSRNPRSQTNRSGR